LGSLKSFKIFGFDKLIEKIYEIWQQSAILKKVLSSFLPSLGENDGKFILKWIFSKYLSSRMWDDEKKYKSLTRHLPLFCCNSNDNWVTP
jgi:hypothetical protein